MDQLQITKGFFLLTVVVRVTTQQFLSQHPLQSAQYFNDDPPSSSNAEPLIHFLDRDEREIILPKSNGKSATTNEITFDSYNMAFPAQLQPFWSNMRWPKGKIAFFRQQQQQQQETLNQEKQINGYENENKGFLLSDRFASGAKHLKTMFKKDNEDDCQNVRGNSKSMSKVKPSTKMFLPRLLQFNDANSKQNQNLRPSFFDQINSAGNFQTVGSPGDGYELYPKRIREQKDNWWDYSRVNVREPETMEPQINDTQKYRKRKAFQNVQRHKSKSLEAPRFIPSISAKTMTNLGHFFEDLKNNVHFMENQELSENEKELLTGDHPINILRGKLNQKHDDNDTGISSGATAFLHAIRTYRPSQKIRSLVSMNPEGYHGSQFLDPNYMWLGLGK